MLKTVIPSDYIEIENIITKIQEKEMNLFLNTQNNEGFTTLLNSSINNLLAKSKKVALVDFNTFSMENYFNPSDLKKEIMIELKDNSFEKAYSKSIGGLSIYHFKSKDLNQKDRSLFLDRLNNIMEKIKEEHDYVFLQNIPMTSINKNNIQLHEIESYIDKTFFIVRSDFISKIKLTNIKETLVKSNINIDGIIIHDYDYYNLFDEIQRQIDKIEFILPLKLSNCLREILKKYKYSNQL